MRRGSERRTDHGFTLLELLVAVSIIALLIGIVVPTIGFARRRAQAATCLSNIRQLSIAAHSYANDNDGYFINYRVPNEQNSHLYWDKDAVGGEWWSSRLVKHDYLPGVEIFKCPAFYTSHDDLDKVTVKPTAENPHGAGGVYWNKVHYGMNVRFLGSRQGWAFPETPLPNGTVLPATEEGPFDETPRLSEVTYPTETIAFTDSKNRAWEVITHAQHKVDPSTPVTTEGIGYLFPAYDPPEIQFGYSHARHAMTIHVGWADGHGDAVKVHDVDNPYHADELTSVPDHRDNNLWDRK